MNKRSEILAILSEVESATFSNMQSVSQLLEFGFRLTGWISFSGETMAEARKALHVARRAAYLKVEASMAAQDKKWAVSLIKDYVNDCCAEENEFFLLCDRCNSCCIHTLDLVRSAVSALKEEMRTVNFHGSA